MRSLFGEKGPLHFEYKSKEIREEKFSVKHFYINIEEEFRKFNVYVVKHNKRLCIPGFTRGYYRNPDLNKKYS